MAWCSAKKAQGYLYLYLTILFKANTTSDYQNEEMVVVKAME
jgi:hypothetical protein